MYVCMYIHKYNIRNPFSIAHTYLLKADHMGLGSLSGAHPWITPLEAVNFWQLFILDGTLWDLPPSTLTQYSSQSSLGNSNSQAGLKTFLVSLHIFFCAWENNPKSVNNSSKVTKYLGERGSPTVLTSGVGSFTMRYLEINILPLN